MMEDEKMGSVKEERMKGGKEEKKGRLYSQ